MEQGICCQPAEPLGMARHVFTHRIWEMSLFHCEMKAPPTAAALAELDGRMVNQAELRALAMPAAMKAARAAADGLLGEHR